MPDDRYSVNPFEAVPKTGDGFPIYPGMPVFVASPFSTKKVYEDVVHFVDQDGEVVLKSSWVEDDGYDCSKAIDWEKTDRVFWYESRALEAVAKIEKEAER
ncbi:MAG: hypothetical protein CMJ75_18855 [Planctomycetaceae bacterium]|nr:hypothetical protein [Planctomycetaceae bacterium]